MTEPLRDTAHSILSVARNAVELAKAELQVAALEAKGSASKLAMAIGLTYLAAVFAQIALLLLALTPILLTLRPWPVVVTSLAIPTLGATVAAFAARRAYVKRNDHGSNPPSPPAVPRAEASE